MAALQLWWQWWRCDGSGSGGTAMGLWLILEGVLSSPYFNVNESGQLYANNYRKKSFPILLVPIFWLASFWSISVLRLNPARVGIRNQYVSSWRAIRKFITCTKVWHTPPDKKVPNVRDCRANDIDNGHANIMDIVTCHVKVSHTATQLALTHYPMPDGIMTDTIRSGVSYKTRQKRMP